MSSAKIPTALIYVAPINFAFRWYLSSAARDTLTCENSLALYSDGCWPELMESITCESAGTRQTWEGVISGVVSRCNSCTNDSCINSGYRTSVVTVREGQTVLGTCSFSSMNPSQVSPAWTNLVWVNVTVETCKSVKQLEIEGRSPLPVSVLSSTIVLFRSHAARRWAGTARQWFKGCWLSPSLILACAYALGHIRFPFDSSGELAWMLVWCDQWNGWCGRALLGEHFLWRYVVDFFALLPQDAGQNRRNG